MAAVRAAAGAVAFDFQKKEVVSIGLVPHSVPMIPETVTFTDYTIYPRDLALVRFYTGPIPIDWTVIRVACAAGEGKIMEWVLDNVDGRFGIMADWSHVTLFFETEMDAIMFRLRGGDDLIQNGSLHS